ncbi:MAG: S8 family serine peptidase [Lachnospiraceae bacterium]|nr:S8 family serine peptidase [Lachnospiraceae bacterium]
MGKGKRAIAIPLVLMLFAVFLNAENWRVYADEADTQEETLRALEEGILIEAQGEIKAEHKNVEEEIRSTENKTERDVWEDNKIRIALLDTGVEQNHPELKNYLKNAGISTLKGREVEEGVDENGHGSAMAQIIVSALRERGISETDVQIFPIKILDQNGMGTAVSLADGIKTAVEMKTDYICIGAVGKGDSALVEQAIGEAEQNGIAVFVPAGNYAEDTKGYTPAKLTEAIVVAAVKDREHLSELSNYGESVDFCARENQKYIDVNGKVQTLNGTSAACAYVTGMAASFGKGLSGKEVEKKLEELAIQTESEVQKGYFGKGFLGEISKKAEKKNSDILEQEKNVEETKEQSTEEKKRSETDERIEGKIKNTPEKKAESNRVYDPNSKKTGYHLEKVGKTLECIHTINDSAYISCEGSGLNPGKAYLDSKMKSSSDQLRVKSKSIRKMSMEEMRGFGNGYENISPYVLQVVLEGDTSEHTLAAPYACPDDGNAGYAYYRHYFSHCNHTKQWYWSASEHVWLGCAGGDEGDIEHYHRTFSHIIEEYRFVANKYKVHFDKNQATSGNMKDQTMVYDKAELLNENKFKRTGYTFIGWNTKKDGSGTAYKDKKSVKNLTTKKDEIVTLYAQWKANTYTVKYNGNGATAGKMSDSKHQYNQSRNLTANGFQRKFQVLYDENYDRGKTAKVTATASFIGWNTKKDATGISYKDGQSVKNLTQSDGVVINLYAKWKDEAIILPSKNREGYDLLGWSTEKKSADMGKITPGYTAGAKVTISEEKTLYAVWKPKTYEIKYDANGGKGTMKDGIKIYSQPYILVQNTFSREGYDFVGWNTKKDGSGTFYKEKASYTKEEKVTFYAQWKIYFQVAYIGNGQTEGKNFLDVGESGYGNSENLEYTFKDNKEDPYFQKIDTIEAYLDEETGKKVMQDTEGTIVGWGLTSDVKVSNIQDKKEGFYEPGEIVRGSTLVEHAIKENNLTVGKPNSDYGQFSEESGVIDVKVDIKNVPFVNLYAIWDLGPVIEAYDRYYTVEQAQSGFITEEELLNAAIATDEEAKCEGNEKGVLQNFVDEKNQTSFTVLDYQSRDFTELQNTAVVSITYQAKDSAGNITKKMVFIHIIDGHDTVADGYDMGREAEEPKGRFISKKYLATLPEDSVWVINSEYRKVLEEAVNYERQNPKKGEASSLLGEAYKMDIPGTGEWNYTPQSVWNFTHEQVLEVKKFVKEHGPSNFKQEDALETFFMKFSKCRK